MHTLEPRSMNLTATSSPVCLSRISLATPKFPLPISRIWKKVNAQQLQAPKPCAEASFLAQSSQESVVAVEAGAYQLKLGICDVHPYLVRRGTRHDCATCLHCLRRLSGNPLERKGAREGHRATDHKAPCTGPLSNSTVPGRSFPSVSSS